MSGSVPPHRRQPTRLSRPWDSPGKNTGVGCHFLLQHMKVKSESEVTRSCLTLSDLMDCSLPGSSVHGIFQGRVLEWGAIPYPSNLKFLTGEIFHSPFFLNPGLPVTTEAKETLCLVTQLCPTLCNPVDCGPPGFSVHSDSPGKNTIEWSPCPPRGSF